MLETKTTLGDQLMPGKMVTIENERWVIGSRHSNSGEPFVLMQLLGNPGITARWMIDDLERYLA